MTSDDFIGFVTLCNQRSGSKFLGGCLRAGADVTALGEIFNPDIGQSLTFWSWLAEFGNDRKISQVTDTLLGQFMGALYTQFGPFHFDIMLNQISAITPPWHNSAIPFILDYLKNCGFYVIMIERSPLDTFISVKKLEITGVAHERESDKPHDIKQIYINPSEYENFLIDINNWNKLISSHFKNYDRFVKVTFDELVSNHGFLPDNINKFISDALFNMNNVYGTSVQTRKNVFGKSPLNQIIVSNFDELAVIEKKYVRTT